MEEIVNILLIDDDEDDFIITKDLLEEIDLQKYHLEWAVNYQQGLNKLLSESYHVCLIDYRLGEKNGIQLIESAICNNIDIPLILLTGRGDKEIDIQAMNVGAADYLVKGEITSQLLERTIRYNINNRNAVNLLKQSENKFRQLFERSLDAIFICDVNHELIDINPSFSEMIKLEKEEILSRKLSDFFVNENDFISYKNNLHEHSQLKDFDVQLNCSDSTMLICQITSIVRNDHLGNIIGYQGFIHDLTLRKKSEEQLLIAEKLSMTGKIARSIAHEVRNPLTNLGLALEQLKDELPDSSEDAEFFVDIIKRNSDRIGQLISEMLNSSKPKDLNKENHLISEALDKSIDLIQDRITLKNMQLKKMYDGVSANVFMDLEKMVIALTNVMVNAIEAMDENLGILQVEIVEMEDSVSILIKDNGKGIADEELSTLFDPFFTNKSGGMGLGLTSTQNIVHSHEGQIEVKSALGDGTQFNIILPK